MTHIYLADADSKLPNLALMRLARFFRDRGDTVQRITPDTRRDLFNHAIGDVYGSSIFATQKSAKARATIEAEWGYVRWGGTGVELASNLREIADIDWDAVEPDYSIYSDFAPSIGFLTRGCRLKCGFCVVPRKEGKPRAVSTVGSLWRGDPHPRHLHLLDNDAFAPYGVDGQGQRQDLRAFWRDAHRELNAGGFKVCFSQGINLRLIDDEAAAQLASLRYVGNDFSKRILYTAWDNLKDEGIFREGVERLRRAGVPPHRLRVFMLTGYRKGETWEDLFYRFSELVALGCEPYVMVYNDDGERPDLLAFERWSNYHAWRSVPWPEYGRDGHRDTRATAAVHAESDPAWSRVVGRMLARG